ncbi:thiamine diphosphokinase [Stagnihabitans tardus]|uniref:Thiamine diphosphokinase n=1 Tax=Stagnihabitans tardus TaxID=2699202 RepID=A0AAE5BVY3_9RHOB|nr:thiamine diphosphokinase [Stagnihabitans tardus]NBZ89451.1 thiamine diphosphokinase [Stagnihabitans tardus]
MPEVIVQSTDGVTLAGGSAFSARLLAEARELAPRVVAADGGADRLLAHGVEPEAVMGDLDSISDGARLRLADRVHHIAEQVTTDFDKALRSIAAPFVVAVGFAGQRLDHGLAVLTSLLAHPEKRCLVMSATDVVFLCPPRLELALTPGSRFSLYPLGEVRCRSEGLRWPTAGLDFSPWGRVGTSNEVAAPRVRLEVDQARMLVILPRRAAGAVARAFQGG